MKTKPVTAPQVILLDDVGTVNVGGVSVRVTASIVVNKPPHRVRAGELLKRATALKADGDWDGAFRALREAYATLGDDIVHYSVETALRLPLYLQQAGHFRESMAEFDKLLTSWEQSARRAIPRSADHLEHMVKVSRVIVLRNRLLAMKRERRRLARLAKAAPRKRRAKVKEASGQTESAPAKPAASAGG